MRYWFLNLPRITPVLAKSRAFVISLKLAQCAFPSECSGAYSEFKKRIKKGRDPLPRLSSCTTGPNGEKVDGHYQLGYERFEPCDDGYVLRERRQGYRSTQGVCYRTQCVPQQYQENYNYRCEHYQAVVRSKPHFIKMWVDGAYLGQYFY